MSTPTPELVRPKKAGLQRFAQSVSVTGQGTPAPNAGYALTIAHHEVARLNFAHEHDRHDVEIGIALVAAKRAVLIGRGPIQSDVQHALSLFGLDGSATITGVKTALFSGLGHSYAAQRRFVDAVSADQLLTPHTN